LKPSRGVIIRGYFYVGGLVGTNRGIIENCFVTGVVSGRREVGGLVGMNHSSTATIRYSFSKADVSGYHSIGGLIGWNHWAEVSNSYAFGNVSSTNNFSGGLIGRNISSRVNNCYSIGSASSVGQAGGLVGTTDVEVFNSYWDIESSGNLISFGGTGKLTSEMKKIATYT
jgi:hypothetical protein